MSDINIFDFGQSFDFESFAFVAWEVHPNKLSPQLEYSAMETEIWNWDIIVTGLKKNSDVFLIWKI